MDPAGQMTTKGSSTLETRVEGARKPKQAGPIRVLLVEDDYDSFRLADRRLSLSREAEFEVSWAASLPDGLTELAQVDFDVIVLDLALPGSAGVAIMAGISAIARHIPIVVLTGSDNDELASTAARIGVQDYLVKENQNETNLVSSVLAAIDRHRLREDTR